MSSRSNSIPSTPRSPYSSRHIPKQALPSDVSTGSTSSEDEGDSSNVLSSPPRRQVRFSPASSLTSVYTTHSPEAYDRSPIIPAADLVDSPRRHYVPKDDCPSPLRNKKALRPSHSLQSVSRNFVSLSINEEEEVDVKGGAIPILPSLPPLGSPLINLRSFVKDEDDKGRSTASRNLPRSARTGGSSFVSLQYSDEEEGEAEGQNGLVDVPSASCESPLLSTSFDAWINRKPRRTEQPTSSDLLPQSESHPPTVSVKRQASIWRPALKSEAKIGCAESVPESIMKPLPPLPPVLDITGEYGDLSSPSASPRLCSTHTVSSADD